MRLLTIALVMGIALTGSNSLSAQDSSVDSYAGVTETTNLSQTQDLSVPIISLKTLGPKSIESDRQADYAITLRNVSSKQDASLKLYVMFTNTAKFMNATPFPNQMKDGVMEFDVESLPRLGEKTFRLSLMPPKSGSIEVKAKYVLKTDTNIATHVRRPKIRFDVTGANEVQINERVPYTITITNPGDGLIRDMLVEPVFPQEVTLHDTENVLTAPFSIAGRGTKKLSFKLEGFESGEHKLRFRLHMANMPAQIVQSNLRIHSRVPTVHFAGPAEHVVGDSGDYTVIVENRSRTIMHGSELTLNLPSFLQIRKISHPCEFQKDINNNWQMVWSLGDLEPGQKMVYRMRGKALAADSSNAQIAIKTNGRLVRNKEYSIAAVNQSTIQQQINSPQVVQPQQIGQPAPQRLVVPQKTPRTIPVAQPVTRPNRIQAAPAIERVKTSSTTNDEGNSVRFLIK